jgi:hypothetical protein
MNRTLFWLFITTGDTNTLDIEYNQPSYGEMGSLLLKRFVMSKPMDEWCKSF